MGGILVSCASPAATTPTRTPAGSSESQVSDGEPQGDGTPQKEEGKIVFNKSEEVTNYVKIEMEDGDSIVIRLLPEYAPITVANFQKLVGQGFYDGLIFHRVIQNFMIQGGDPTGTGYYGSGETIKGEFVANGVANYLAHSRGVVSMARSDNMNSASSQFFICQVDYPSLNGMYAAFGIVVDGMETVDKIAAVKTNKNDKPLTDQRMKSVYFVLPQTDTAE